MNRFNTGIQATPQFRDILSSIIGQMSDGIWENTRSMERYWRSLGYEVDQNGYIVILDRYNEVTDPVSFFANKIKQIINIEIRDGNTRLIWDRVCRAVPQYLDRSAFTDRPCVTVGDCYHLYDLLKGRNTNNKVYAHLRPYNLEITFRDMVIPVSVWAWNDSDATKQAIEKVNKEFRIRVIR